MSVSSDMADYLQAQDYARIGDNLFIGYDPEKDDKTEPVLTIYDYGGREDLLSGEDGIARPNVQFHVRGQKYNEIYTFIDGAIRKFINLTTQKLTDTGYTYIGFWIMNGPLNIGRDDRNRHRLTANLRCLLQREG